MNFDFKAILSNPVYLVIIAVALYFGYQWYVKMKAKDALAARRAEKVGDGK